MTFAGLTDRFGLARRERLWISLILLVLIAFGAFDFIEDWRAGADRSALWNDVSDLVLPLLLLGYIWRHLPLTTQRQARRLKDRDTRREVDLVHWRRIATSYLQGLGAVIDQQFATWELTPAEREVGLLLLKGLSMRQVAEIRSISERTARQQAGSVYTKSGLEGRAELAAFFLEDLLLPQTV